MTSPEQMGGKPEQPKDEPMENREELERKLTSPEEAAKKTRQRRIKYGLKEVSELTVAELEEINITIENLLKRLDEYDFCSLSPELQDEWYWVEAEAEAGKDRELAKAVLERFLDILKESK